MASRSLGTLTVDLVAKTAGFTAGLDKAARDADKRMSQIEKRAYQFGTVLGKGIQLAAVGFAAATAAVTALTVQSINYADELDELSQKLGISAEQLSKWAYAANLSGTDINTVARSVNLLGRNLAEAADPASKMGETFAALRISVKDAAGNLRSAKDVLPEIADRFKALDNQTTETALAMQLFGRSGADLLEFLNRGSDGIAELEDELASLGGVISNDTAAAAAEFKDELDRLKIMGQGLGLQIAQRLLPTLIDTVQEFRQLVKEGDLVANVVTVVSSAMTAGVSVINAYNIAVERTGLLFSALAQAAAGYIETSRNVATFGLAEGGVASGIGKMVNAPVDATLAAMQLQAAREAQGAKVSVNLIDPGEGLEAWKKEKALAADAAALQERINKLLEDAATGTKKVTGAKKEKNTVDREALELQRELERQAQEEARMYRESMRRVEDNIKIGKEVNARWALEVEMLGKSNREREKMIALAGLSNEALMGEGEQIKKNIDAWYDGMERIEIMDTVRDGFQNFFTDVISGTASVTDAFKNMLDDINAQILRRITNNWVEQLFGAMGSSAGGASGGWLSMFAGMFGGGRASGGWTKPNTMYEVNERGLEMATVNGRDYMLTGNSPVHVTPNHRLGRGGVSQTNNFVIQGRIDRRTESQIAQDVGRKTQTAMVRNG